MCVTSDSRNMNLWALKTYLGWTTLRTKESDRGEICIITHNFLSLSLIFCIFLKMFLLMRICTFNVMFCWSYLVLTNEICFKMLRSDPWQTLWAVNLFSYFVGGCLDLFFKLPSYCYYNSKYLKMNWKPKYSNVQSLNKVQSYRILNRCIQAI